MLVTFKTRAYPNITMFGDVAMALLQLMGQSGNVPGALRAEDVAPALERLRAALDRAEAAPPGVTPSGDDGNDDEQHVPLDKRAYPLIELLAAASERDCHVMWESGA